MKKNEFVTLIEDTFTSIKMLTATKGEEYSHDADQLANFRRGAANYGVREEIVLGIYLMKHIDAINSYIALGYVSSEPIESRIDDAILYLLLLKAMERDSRFKSMGGMKQASAPQASDKNFVSLVGAGKPPQNGAEERRKPSGEWIPE